MIFNTRIHTHLLFVFSLSACSNLTSISDKTHFYSLTALPSSADNKTTLRIGVGPLQIPRLLNRPHIVSRHQGNEINISERHQWGGAYKEELIQAITDNLSAQLKTDSIEQYPWKFAFKPHYQIRINIERFDGERAKRVTLKARWRILKRNKEIFVKQSVITTATTGKSYNDYIKAQSQTLITFSQEITNKIKKMGLQ
ncbi:MAG: membrane integrity-associated transporter subunit PqiC [Cocleimonas sp.]|nr:membrane integrity-associated transporter subunit PqiC [Cocleimonas sp.]